jgi:hypothetical protein
VQYPFSVLNLQVAGAEGLGSKLVNDMGRDKSLVNGGLVFDWFMVMD